MAPRLALTVAAITAPLGLLAAVPLGLVCVLAAALFTGAGVLYDVWLKGTAWSALPFLVAFPALPIWAWSAVAPFEPRLLRATSSAARWSWGCTWPIPCRTSKATSRTAFRASPTAWERGVRAG